MDPHPNATIDALDMDGDVDEERPPHRITTDRLVLRRVHSEETDFERLHALFGDVANEEAVFALCGWDGHDDEAATRSYLDDRTERWKRGEYYEYVLSADGEYVGTTCLDVHRDDGSWEFGLWLDRPYWGRGYSGEVTDALVHVAFEHLDAPYVVAGCRAPNDRSRRAIEAFARRYGGAYFGSPPTVQSRHLDADQPPIEPHHEWVVTREQFDAGEAGLSTLVPGVEYDELEL